MSIDILLILACVVLPILTAVGGAWQAKQKGEKINWVVFSKTIIIGLITGGFITQATGDVLVAIFSTEMITIALDTLVNAIINKNALTKKA